MIFFNSIFMNYKKCICSWSSNFFIWDNAWRLYAHVSDLRGNWINNIIEWYVDYYSSCDAFNDWVSEPTNCIAQPVDSSTPELYNNFLKTVTTADKFYYNLYRTWEYWSTPMWYAQLCISSFTLNKSLCWGIWWARNNYAYPSLWWQLMTVSNSKSLWVVTFWQLNGALSPAIDWSIDWWDSSAVIWTLWGNQNYIQCTLSTALDWYKYKWYSERLCYWWLDDFWIYDTAIPIYWQWLTITDVFSWTRSLRAQWHSWSDFTKSNWFWYWRNLYKWYKNGMYNNNPFSNVPTVLFTYFWAVDVYWWAFDNDSILEFCKISLHDWDLTALYSWK